jgi:two-component sensor histidine kinase
MHTHRPLALAFETIYVTDELDRRPAKACDPLLEKRALHDLIGKMADQPEEVLPRFVDLAMEITGGVAAGLSLLSQEPAPGVFVWKYLRGSLMSFEGAETPRNFSPCGVTLDHDGPVLSRHPERVYDWISDAGIVVPEVMLVPLKVGDGSTLGTLWIVSEEVDHFVRDHARAMTELAWFVGIALRMLETEQRLQQALEAQETLTQEMSHRVKNVFAITDGLIRMSARGAESKDDLADSLSGRLHALASAHSLVSRNLRQVGQPPRASDLRSLIGAVVAPYETQGAAGQRFSIAGPLQKCGEHAINSIALVFHELATNAAKYGALAASSGSVSVDWTLGNEHITIRWVEHGGEPPKASPDPAGFGTRLMERTIGGQLDGSIAREWLADGLSVTMVLPLERIAI